MAASLLGLGLTLGGPAALAQSPAPSPPPGNWVVVPAERAAKPAPVVVPLPEVKPGAGVNWRNSGNGGPMTPPAVAPAVMKPTAPAPASPTPDLQAALLQQPPPGQRQEPLKAPTEETSDIQVQLEPPGPDRVFRRESEENLHERMRQEARGRRPMDRIDFPSEPVLSTEQYAGRTFPPMVEIVEPNYVCYDRLYFEDKNSERFGWDLGFIQPFVSTAYFYADLIVLPYHIGTAPCRKFECNAGYCLPGDPVPYLLYPPDLSLTGAAAETGSIIGLFAIFPG